MPRLNLPVFMLLWQFRLEFYIFGHYLGDSYAILGLMALSKKVTSNTTLKLREKKWIFQHLKATSATKLFFARK